MHVIGVALRRRPRPLVRLDGHALTVGDRGFESAANLGQPLSGHAHAHDASARKVCEVIAHAEEGAEGRSRSESEGGR